MLRETADGDPVRCLRWHSMHKSSCIPFFTSNWSCEPHCLQPTLVEDLDVQKAASLATCLSISIDAPSADDLCCLFLPLPFAHPTGVHARLVGFTRCAFPATAPAGCSEGRGKEGCKQVTEGSCDRLGPAALQAASVAGRLAGCKSEGSDSKPVFSLSESW